MSRKRRELPWLATRNGVYYATWFDKETKHTRGLSLATSDPGEAAVKFAAFLQGGRSVFASSVATIGFTVAKMLDDYEIEHVNTKVVDKARQIDALTHLRAYFGSVQVADLDIPASRGYAEARRSGAIGGGPRHRGDRAKGSDSTIRRELNVLRAAIGHARKWRRLNGADPVVELPAGAAPDENKWLTRDELRRLHAAAVGPVRDFITLAYYTAARRASVETLRVEQVNLSTGRLSLRKEGERATKKRKPVLAIHPSALPVLERLCAEARDGWLFGGPNVDFYRPFRDAARAAGIPDDRSNPHVLRHSRASHLLQAGVSIWDVAKLLGDTIATVERVYGHHCPDYNGATGAE